MRRASGLRCCGFPKRLEGRQRQGVERRWRDFLGEPSDADAQQRRPDRRVCGDDAERHREREPAGNKRRGSPILARSYPPAHHRIPQIHC
jgi:hypothetical protein